MDSLCKTRSPLCLSERTLSFSLSLTLTVCKKKLEYFLILYLELHHKFQIWQSLLSKDKLPKEYDWQLIHVASY